MARKKMYTTELKLEIVNHYLTGTVSANQLAKKYHIGSKSDIYKWVSAYQKHGIESLRSSSRNYSGDFKIAVVEYIHNTGASIRATAAHFNIASHPTISRWKRIYDEEGKEALYEERRGRASKMKKSNIEKTKTYKQTTDSNEDLLAEVQRLRMENEYLKKLNALIQEREESEKPIK